MFNPLNMNSSNPAVREVLGPGLGPLGVGALEEAPASVPDLGAQLQRALVRAVEALGGEAGRCGGGCCHSGASGEQPLILFSTVLTVCWGRELCE